MRQLRWSVGATFLIAGIATAVLAPATLPFYPEAHFGRVVGLALYLLVLGGALCLYRVLRGPTAADRIVAVDIFGVLITGFCAVAAVATKRDWYLDIGIVWALQSFIGSLAMAKYLEGRSFDA